MLQVLLLSPERNPGHADSRMKCFAKGILARPSLQFVDLSAALPETCASLGEGCTLPEFYLYQISSSFEL